MMSDTELYSTLPTSSSSPLVSRKSAPITRRSSKPSRNVTRGDLDFRATQSDNEILESGNKLRKKRGSRLIHFGSSLKRFGSGKKAKEAGRKNHIPSLVSALGNIAFGIGAGITLDTHKDSENNEAKMRTLHSGNCNGNLDSYKNSETGYNDVSYASVCDSGDGCVYIDSTSSIHSNGDLSCNSEGLTNRTLHAPVNNDVECEQNSREMSYKSQLTGHTLSAGEESPAQQLVSISSSDDSLDELDGSRPNSLGIKNHRPVRRLHKSYKIAIKNRPIKSPSPNAEQPQSTTVTDDADTDDLEDTAATGPSPFKRNMYKSYRVAMTKLKDEDSSGYRSGKVPRAADKEKARQAELARKFVRNQRSMIEILTPPEVVKVIPPSPQAKHKSASLPLRSSLNGDFVSITDLRKMGSSDNRRRSSHAEEHNNGSSSPSISVRRNRPCSSPDMETVPICEDMTPPSSRRRPVMHRFDSVALRLPCNDVLSESPNSSIAGSQDEFCPSRRHSLTDSESDSESENSLSSGSKSEQPSNSLQSIEEEEMKEHIAPLKTAMPRILKQRKKGRDSVRRLRDKRVDVMISEQENELMALQRSRSWNNFPSNKMEADPRPHSSKSMKGVSAFKISLDSNVWY